MHLKRGFIVVLLVFGLWQLGQAGYLTVKAQLAQFLLHQAWHSMQAGELAVKPWAWADTSPLVKLQFGSNGSSMIVLAGASGRNLAFAPAHVSGSALPGQKGVSVIGGHRDTHFSKLQQVQVSDSLIVEYPSGKRLHYQVTEIAVVDSRESRLALDAEQSMLALVACYPFQGVSAGGPLRFVVMAEETLPGSLSTKRIVL